VQNQFGFDFVSGARQGANEGGITGDGSGIDDVVVVIVLFSAAGMGIERDATPGRGVEPGEKLSYIAAGLCVARPDVGERISRLLFELPSDIMLQTC